MQDELAHATEDFERALEIVSDMLFDLEMRMKIMDAKGDEFTWDTLEQFVDAFVNPLETAIELADMPLRARAKRQANLGLRLCRS
jgi:hypothetical protein